MRMIIIAGSRNIHSYELVDLAVREACAVWRIPVGCIRQVVSGAQRGVDQLGEEWARQHGIEPDRFPAEWERLGLAAGPIRNEVMARFVAEQDPDGGLVAVWSGSSPGTRNMIGNARAYGLRVYVRAPWGPITR